MAHNANINNIKKHILCERLSDSQGNMDPAMKPFWYLCIVASSFIMLSESTENTLYNMAQVGRITQLVSGLDLSSHI